MSSQLPIAETPVVRQQDRDDKKLLWLIFIRVAIVTVLLGSTIAVQFSGTPAPLPLYLYALVAVVYLLTLVYIWLLLRHFSYRTQAVVQVGGDIAVYSVLVYVTGGADSAFPFIYSMAIINAAILLYRRGALVTAAVCTAAFASMTILGAARVLPPFEASLAPPVEPSTVTAVNTVLVNGAAFFFVALLSSYLAEQLRAAETELARTRGGLADLRLLSENILRSIGDGLCTASLDGRITYANGAALEILGLRETDLVGRPLGEIFPELGREILASPGGGWKYREIRVPGAHGQPVWLGLSASVLVDRSDVSRGWLIVFHDLTPLKEMTDRAQRSERLAAIGKLAADMAHEIRNPLASMSGSIELLSHDERLSPDSKQLMGIVLTEAARLNKLISDFLDYARPARPHPIPLDLRDVALEAAKILEHGRLSSGIELVTHTEAPTPLEVDLNQVKQVLWNLVKNALEAMPSGGVLSLVVSPTPGGGAVLEVSDTGHGIAPEDLSRIFDPFFTTKERGLGLGLATVHRIVEACGGSVSARSKPGEGSTFTVKLPARPAAAGSASAAA